MPDQRFFVDPPGTQLETLEGDLTGPDGSFAIETRRAGPATLDVRHVVYVEQRVAIVESLRVEFRVYAEPMTPMDRKMRYSEASYVLRNRDVRGGGEAAIEAGGSAPTTASRGLWAAFPERLLGAGEVRPKLPPAAARLASLSPALFSRHRYGSDPC
ncbi:MAG: hypothetical protein ACREMK_06705 [Gemmatimonadota bacterium]